MEAARDGMERVLITTITSAASRRSAQWAPRDTSFLSEGDTFLVVEVSGSQVKVINQEGRGGWVNLPIGEDWIENTFAGGMTGNGT